MVKPLITLTLILSFMSNVALAQDNRNHTTGKGPKHHLSRIILSGLAGAVLGLSTLSFYGRPQDKLSNIALGAAVGVIGGAVFSTYQVAREPHEAYGAELDPQIWQYETRPMPKQAAVPKFSWSFEF